MNVYGALEGAIENIFCVPTFIVHGMAAADGLDGAVSFTNHNMLTGLK